jgi:hypothetical protein
MGGCCIRKSDTARLPSSVILSREDGEGSQKTTTVASTLRPSHFEILRYAQNDGSDTA